MISLFNTFPASWWIGLPNVPNQYVFWHMSPLKICQSTKICTGVIWGTFECKSCLALVANLPMSFPYANHSASNIHESFKYRWHSFQLRCIHCDSWYIQKPNLTTVSMELRFCELFSFDLWPNNCFTFAKFHVQTINKLKT